MKKVIICFFFILLVFSCDINSWNDTIIENTSGFNVSFEFNNTDQIVLMAGEQATFPTTAYQYLLFYSPDKRVYFTYEATNDGYAGWFHEYESWVVNVKNTLGEKATLSADGWMEDIEDIEDNIQTGRIYTSNPDFTVTQTVSNFPAAAVYNRDTDGTFNVTIQWSK